MYCTGRRHSTCDILAILRISPIPSFVRARDVKNGTLRCGSSFFNASLKALGLRAWKVKFPLRRLLGLAAFHEW